MDNDTPDPMQELLALVRSYILRGSVQKFKANPETNKAQASQDHNADIPGELFMILQSMQDGDDKISPEMLEAFRQHDRKLRQLEADLTPEQKQNLDAIYKQLKQAENFRDVKNAEAELSKLDQAVQDVFAAQKRLRQSLASRIYHAWKQQNSQDEDSGDDENDDSDDAYQDESDMSEDGDAEDEDSEEKSDQDGDSQNGDSQDGDSQDGDSQQESASQSGESQDPYSEQGERAEDSQKGLEKWLNELDEKTQEAEKEAEAEAEAEAEEGDGDQEGDSGASKGNGKGSFDPAEKGDPTYELSNDHVDPRHLRIVRQAFEKLLMRGRNNPSALPRWDKREFVKRMMTSRPLRPAKKPTLERQAVMFIIDNSGSMSALEGAARAFAAALSKASGPTGSDVVVVTSFNGNFINSDVNRKNQAECWFLNGTYMGFLPEPSSASRIDKINQGQCWEWFIRKELRRRGVNVKMVGIYGDNNGANVWCYLSNAVKDIPCLWFNPSDVNGLNRPGSVMFEKNPYINDRQQISPTKTHKDGDLRYEKFRGLSFLRVRSADDIVNTLKRHIRN